MDFPLKILNDRVKSLDQFNGYLSVWGDYGVGKTTFSLQTAFHNSSLGKIVLFVYTKPNLPYEKIKNLSQKFTKDELNNFHLFLVLDFAELYDIVLNLEFIIIEINKRNRASEILIIFDSITNLYHMEFRKSKKSKNVILNYQLNQILATLSHLNATYEVSILIVNYLRNLKQQGQSKEIQSGGKVMDYWVDYSIKIERHKKLNYRKIFFSKNPEEKELSFFLKLTELGFE